MTYADVFGLFSSFLSPLLSKEIKDMNVNLNENSPDYFILSIEGKLNEGISHLFYHLRNQLEKTPKPVFFDFSQITQLKDNALQDFSRLIGEIERKKITVRILKSASEILSQLQKEELDELLMTPEELKEKGFSEYLDSEGKLPYTLPLARPKVEKNKKREVPFSFEDVPSPNPSKSSPKTKTPKPPSSTPVSSLKTAQSEALIQKILEKKETTEPESSKKVFRLL